MWDLSVEERMMVQTKENQSRGILQQEAKEKIS
jgi:hypothetical protein